METSVSGGEQGMGGAVVRGVRCGGENGSSLSLWVRFIRVPKHDTSPNCQYATMDVCAPRSGVDTPRFILTSSLYM